MIEEKDGQIKTIRVRATTEPKTIGPVDLIIVFVKCYHTDVAGCRGALIGPDTTVLSLQNGWGNADRISNKVGRDRVVVGITYHSATLIAPGQVRHPGVGMTFIGELDGTETPRLLAVAGALRDAGLDVTAAPKSSTKCGRSSH